MFTIFDKLGGEAAAVSIIEAGRGLKLSPFALRSWKEKRKIPAINAMILMDECRKRGIDFDLSDFTAERQRAERKTCGSAA